MLNFKFAWRFSVQLSEYRTRFGGVCYLLFQGVTNCDLSAMQLTVTNCDSLERCKELSRAMVIPPSQTATNVADIHQFETARCLVTTVQTPSSGRLTFSVWYVTNSMLMWNVRTSEMETAEAPGSTSDIGNPFFPKLIVPPTGTLPQTVCMSFQINISHVATRKAISHEIIILTFICLLTLTYSISLYECGSTWFGLNKYLCLHLLYLHLMKIGSFQVII